MLRSTEKNVEANISRSDAFAGIAMKSPLTIETGRCQRRRKTNLRDIACLPNIVEHI